jgi:glycosyltransferase involved in cell wall biosynthesis
MRIIVASQSVYRQNIGHLAQIVCLCKKRIPFFLPIFAAMSRIICTVTNDLTYDQRMQRICGSLAKAGYDVLLVGRKMTSSKELINQNFQQKRLNCWAQKGKLFYIEYNLRLFFFLLFTKADVLCAIDLDSIIPNLWASKIKGCKRVYDAHEIFTEMFEVVRRPAIQKFWLRVERYAVPQFPIGYTVNQFIVDELQRRYAVQYGIVRNMPLPLSSTASLASPVQGRYILYQGAVNEGRSFETLIPAMQNVNAQLIICGNGNFMDEVKRMIALYQLEDKVKLLGMIEPTALRSYTANAYIGLTLFDQKGMNQYYSLANRFFDYVQSGIPQLCVGYPEYKAINDEHGVAYLVDDTAVETLSTALNKMLTDTVLYEQLKSNCAKAKQILNWEQEEKKLIEVYQHLLTNNGQIHNS